MHLSFRMFPRYLAFSAALLIGTSLLLAGCGGHEQNAPTAVHIPITITEQPLDQTVPSGSSATFSVFASSVAALTYQWSEDGVAIPGATESTYTTQPASPGSDGSNLSGTYQVTISNGTTSVASSPVTLTLGPRSPKAGDLRYLLFQQVDIPEFLNSEGGNIGATVYPYEMVSEWAHNAIGGPLSMGWPVCSDTTTCAWVSFFKYLPPPMTGLNMNYQGGEYSNFTSDLQSYAAPNVVFMSMDLEPAANAYAIAWVWANTPQTGTFDYRLEVVPPAQIPATAAQDGVESRVITAASFDANGQANLISYGWTGDTTTVYETQTYIVPPSQVCTTAATLAGNGYIISAFGGNDTLGYMLIGMRVQGDTLPRSIDDIYAENPPYFTPVVELYDPMIHCVVNEQ